MEGTPKMHFSAFITNPCSRRRWKMMHRCCLCSLSVQLATSRSSWKAKQKASLFLTLYILGWKVLLALRRPNGILVYSNRPNAVVMAVLQMSSGCMGIW